MPPLYEKTLPARIPPPYGPEGKAWGGVVGRQIDAILSRLWGAIYARFPDLAPSDGLDAVGRDRRLPRSPGEADASYAARLKSAFSIWRGDDRPLVGKGGGAGSPLGLLQAIKALGLPVGTSGATVVQHNGRWFQLHASTGVLIKGVGSIAINRQDLTGAAPGTLRGFTLDARDQFYARFAVIFPVDVPGLREGTEIGAALSRAANDWRQAKEHYVGGFVHEVGGGWDWPVAQTWDDGSTWDSDTVHFIPPLL